MYAVNYEVVVPSPGHSYLNKKITVFGCGAEVTCGPTNLRLRVSNRASLTFKAAGITNVVGFVTCNRLDGRGFES
jgi:hypothetical protein